MAESAYDAVIIGSGHNGLITAGYLAKDGLKVLVLERVDRVGGAVSTEEIFPGFFGPYCAYISYMLQGKVIDDLKLRDHGLEILSVGGATYGTRSIHPYPDGTFIGGPNITGPYDTAEQIRKQFNEHDARNYFAWNEFWEQASGILYPYFLTEPPSLADLMESVRGTRKEQVLEKMLTWSLMDLLDDHFDDDRVKANFLGIPECDPSAPGSIMSNAYFRQSQFSRDQDRGIPRGSMGAIITALAASVKSLGVEIRTGATVKEVIVENGEARGVRLVNGEEIKGFMVISNADPKRTFLTLVKEGDIGEALVKKARNWKTQAGCIKFLAAMKEPPDFSRYLGKYDHKAIVSVNICPSTEYFQRSWDDNKRGIITKNPLMHIQMPSLVDPNLTPRGGVIMSNWTLHYPAHPKDGPWDDAKGRAVGENIIEILTEYAPNFRSSLIDWNVQTPADIEVRTGLTDGNIRHGDMIPQQMLDKRFPYRTPIKNFYLCGGGAHPGGEVTGGPGHNCAHVILRDLERVAARPVGR